jgi:hypothetical protein
MTRYNYRQSAFERLIGRRPRIEVDQRLRSSLIAVALAVFVVVAVAAAEGRRLALLDADLAALHDRIVVAEQADARDGRVRRTVLAERRVRDAVLDAQRDGIVVANTIARIGNELPPQTWLTGLHDDHTGTWSVAGRSTQIDQIGATLEAIGRLDSASSARLVSITASGRRGRMLDFTIAWEPTR